VKVISKIFLVWRKGAGFRRITVGVIKKNVSEGVTFKYLEKGVSEAESFGFTPYEGFPDLNTIYTKNVAEIFGQRIVRSERNDISEFYDFWHIDLTRKDDSFYMLAFTQGLLPTDTFEFLADFNPQKGLTFVTEIAGIKRKELKSDVLKVHDILTYKWDENNTNDDYAVEVFKGDLSLGYIKKIHSRVFTRSNSKFMVRVKHIEKNGVLSRVFLDISL
jgi:hypothetical protein